VRKIRSRFNMESVTTNNKNGLNKVSIIFNEKHCKLLEI
jgi:hypothetical protein